MYSYVFFIGAPSLGFHVPSHVPLAVRTHNVIYFASSSLPAPRSVKTVCARATSEPRRKIARRGKKRKNSFSHFPLLRAIRRPAFRPVRVRRRRRRRVCSVFLFFPSVIPFRRYRSNQLSGSSAPSGGSFFFFPPPCSVREISDFSAPAIPQFLRVAVHASRIRAGACVRVRQGRRKKYTRACACVLAGGRRRAVLRGAYEIPSPALRFAGTKSTVAYIINVRPRRSVCFLPRLRPPRVLFVLLRFSFRFFSLHVRRDRCAF